MYYKLNKKRFQQFCDNLKAFGVLALIVTLLQVGGYIEHLL